MNLSQRERNIAIVVGILIGLFLLDYVLVEPLLAARDERLTAIQTAEDDLHKGRDLIELRPRLDRRLGSNVRSGLTRDQSSAESQLLNNLRQWALDSDLSLPSLKPSGTAQTVLKQGGKAGEKEKAFMKVNVRATGTGNLVQVTRFMYRIQSAAIPVRITDFSITSKKDGTDDLEVNLNISSIFLTADAGQLIDGVGATSHPSSSPASQPRGRS